MRNCLKLIVIASFASLLISCNSLKQEDGSSLLSSRSEQPTGSDNGEISLAWNAVTTSHDGQPLTSLGGYRIYYGSSSNNYTESVDVGNNLSHTLRNLRGGSQYYFAVKAYGSDYMESDFSNEISTVVP